MHAGWSVATVKQALLKLRASDGVVLINEISCVMIGVEHDRIETTRCSQISHFAAWVDGNCTTGWLRHWCTPGGLEHETELEPLPPNTASCLGSCPLQRRAVVMSRWAAESLLYGVRLTQLSNSQHMSAVQLYCLSSRRVPTTVVCGYRSSMTCTLRAPPFQVAPHPPIHVTRPLLP